MLEGLLPFLEGPAPEGPPGGADEAGGIAGAFPAAAAKLIGVEVFLLRVSIAPRGPKRSGVGWVVKCEV